MTTILPGGMAQLHSLTDGAGLWGNCREMRSNWRAGDGGWGIGERLKDHGALPFEDALLGQKLTGNVSRFPLFVADFVVEKLHGFGRNFGG